MKALRELLEERGIDPGSMQQLFRNRRGKPLTRFGVRYLLRKYADDASAAVTTLDAKRVHPHMIRHTTAVHLLQAGVDLVTISHSIVVARPGRRNGQVGESVRPPG